MLFRDGTGMPGGWPAVWAVSGLLRLFGAAATIFVRELAGDSDSWTAGEMGCNRCCDGFFVRGEKQELLAAMLVC